MSVPKISSLLICCLAFACLSFVRSNAQTDTIAKNSVADGSNLNPASPEQFSYKPHLVAKLDKEINETSGLISINGQLWTINDGGNPARLFQIDTTTGKILRKITVANAVNTDWEGITQDDSSIYIGDFGNNYGNRKDLHILKITKSDLFNHDNDPVEAGFIYFSYPDQNDFNRTPNATNFDCEAFFCLNDSLHIFSKNWLDLKTRHYVIPSKPGSYEAIFVEEFEADGLITDASINEQGNIVLLGYKNTGGKFWHCFCWLLSDYGGSRFFDGNTIRLELGSASHLGQSEGIVFSNENTALLSSESIRIGCLHRQAKLFRINLSKYF